MAPNQPTAVFCQKLLDGIHPDIVHSTVLTFRMQKRIAFNILVAEGDVNTGAE